MPPQEVGARSVSPQAYLNTRVPRTVQVCLHNILPFSVYNYTSHLHRSTQYPLIIEQQQWQIPTEKSGLRTYLACLQVDVLTLRLASWALPVVVNPQYVKAPCSEPCVAYSLDTVYQ
ncbi:hypothetical protein CY34DRAFT_189279 [Suillus luteus UH-Slu-Lm8-n1]|uniref:Uncharacterized protein n=1 Tax=Suillus luteus UH-Slu-Lm8-n1 TaxID=930992 RepID=A0A0C9ZV41_9AGAM|nr:hypothetical protein CY34DRAFT_189279 [Suillus luteus UH-Slu-Lm8-n1]